MANNNSDVLIRLEMKYANILPSSICIFGVIAHVFLIVAFIKDPLKCFRNAGTYLVGHLAISDLLFCLASLVERHILVTWHLILLFVKHVCVGVSILTIAAISIDRFLLIVYPMKYRVFMKGKLIVVWSACIWLILSGISSEVFIRNSLNDLTVHIKHFSEITAIIFSCVMYGLTYFKLKKQSRNLARESISHRQEQTRVMKEKRFLRTISFIACIQMVCIVPSIIFYNYQQFHAPREDNPLHNIGLFYLNFAVNPMVYILRLPNYQKTFCILYCCKAGR
ncbi:melanocortin receptor 5-like [Dendronephthya gigantea]|uniref:melanocortin receptor 5-like n=1 Tax=Dendronephthya gigantea TaxID=151771 RepID=UPI00106A4EC4|nr:melanocortin receptor 5-like [Dendronephthya gigantea]